MTMMRSTSSTLMAYLFGVSSTVVSYFGYKWIKQKWIKIAHYRSSNHVYIVGAGPGAFDQLTIRAHQLIQSADVLLVDALVDPIIYAKAQGQILRVGKRGGGPDSIAQSDLNTILVSTARQDLCVVRLKGGDPGIFGRLYEETEALKKADCTYDIVSGISSAFSATNAAGIPLTHAALSRSVVFLSGHEPETLDYKGLVRMDTIVLLMATRKWDTIAERLQSAGLDPTTPLVVVRSCFRLDQIILKATVSTLQFPTNPFSPSVIIVGQVAALAL